MSGVSFATDIFRYVIDFFKAHFIHILNHPIPHQHEFMILSIYKVFFRDYFRKVVKVGRKCQKLRIAVSPIADNGLQCR